MRNFIRYRLGINPGDGNTEQSLSLDEAYSIEGITRAIWVEKYRDHGEFSFEAPLTARLGAQLPLGTLVSHTNTLELMIVEDREITISDNDEPIEIITGRSMTSYMDYRLCGNLIPWSAQGTKKVETYTLASAATWIQVYNLINEHLDPGELSSAYSAVWGTNWINTFFSGFTFAGEQRTRVVKAFQTLWEAVVEVAEVEDLGIQCLRPPAGYKPNSPADPRKINYKIHRGINRGEELQIDSISEFKDAKYFWSTRNMYNRAEIRGKWVHLNNVYTQPIRGLGLRQIFIQGDYDAAIVDQPPVGSGAENFAVELLRYYGLDVMRTQHYYWKSMAEVSPSSEFAQKCRYRQDYGLGDLISVRNDYDYFQPKTLLRVTEFAETWDEDSYEAIPTLTTPLHILED